MDNEKNKVQQKSKIIIAVKILGVFVLIIFIGITIYRGGTVKKIGIPGFEIEFGDSKEPSPTLTPKLVRTPQPTPSPTLIPHVKPKVTQSPIVKLRKVEGEFSKDEIKNMFLNKNFRHRHYNPNGNFPNNYEIQERNGSYVVIDYATGLMWQQIGSATYMTWDEAQEYISNELNKTNYAGCSLWRLPTLEELASLLEPKEGKGGMFIDSVFESNSAYWTSDRVKGSEHMWYISFSHSLVYTTEKASKHCYVRAVCSFH